MSHLTARRRFAAIGAGLAFTLLVATPAAAQLVKAEVGVDGMT